MPVAARRVFRLSLTVALSLVVAYGLGLDMPFVVPMFAFLLTAKPGPPMGLKALLLLSLVVVLTLGLGLLLIPVLLQYPQVGILLVAIGIFLSSYVTVVLGKGLVGVLLTAGITLITAAGMLSDELARIVIESLLAGVIIGIVTHRVVYPWFPETETPPAAAEAPASADQNLWVAVRTTLVVLPAYLLTLTNPGAYLAIILKAVSLGQQVSAVQARDAARELLGSTFLGGCLAIAFWAALGIGTNLYMFFLWMLLFGVLISARFYQVVPSRHPPSFWQNVLVTMLILLGFAVQDSASGKDVYQAFAVRMSLFVAVTCYAVLAVVVLDRLRARRVNGYGSESAAIAPG